MRWLPVLRLAGVATLLATLIVAALAFNMMGDNRRYASRASNGIMMYSLAERTLQVDLLTARAGMLRSYEPVDADLVAAEESLSGLGKLPMPSSARQALAGVAAAAARQEVLVQQFKHRNRLLQRALTQFAANDDAKIDQNNILSAWILRLTLDTSKPTVLGAQSALDALPRARPGTADAALVTHARRLVEILPEIDRLLNAIRGMDMEKRVRQFQMLIREEVRNRESALRRLQICFGFLITLLTAIVTAMILVQRQHTRELQSQADNERLSAAIAMPLIDTGHETFEARVQDAVNRLAFYLRAKRLRLMIPGIAAPVHFSAPHVDDEQEWFCQLVRVADANSAWAGDRVMASTRGNRGHPAVIEAMRTVGVSDLVLLRTVEPHRLIIGFEPSGAAFAQRRDHMAGLASALVAIAHGARREAMQQERERLEKKVARAGRMEIIGVMASGVAHNFNNIICAIGGYAEMGQERTRKGSPAYRHFGEILHAVGRARNLVDEILNFAKQGRSQKRPADLLDILRESVQLVSASARQNQIRLLTSEGSFPVIGAASELQQVFLNICNNAVHAGDGETVTIEAGRVNLVQRRRLSHGMLPSGQYVVVSVTDRGPGIAASARCRLFEPFFTTKLGGTGLGLSTAWEIVQDHGGSIDVENINPGARFSVWLPERAGTDDYAIAGDGARILLLAQSEQLAEEEELLAELGYEPIGFPLSTGIAAMSQALKDCDGALITSFNTEIALKSAELLSAPMAGRPMLVATPEAQLLRSRIRAAKIAYPLKRKELAARLPAVISGATPALH
ncbi:ATP-binding protein [Sphingomonas sp.]|uniref:ATP-binding protein n=1 Tax=Sphingomonas sp. TaxID=28214 RepID=UPI003B3B541D